MSEVAQLRPKSAEIVLTSDVIYLHGQIAELREKEKAGAKVSGSIAALERVLLKRIACLQEIARAA